MNSILFDLLCRSYYKSRLIIYFFLSIGLIGLSCSDQRDSYPQIYDKEIPLNGLRNIEFEGEKFLAGFSQKLYNKGEPIFFIIKDISGNEKIDFKMGGRLLSLVSKQGDLIYKTVGNTTGPKRSTLEITHKTSKIVKREIFMYEVKDLNLYLKSKSNNYLYSGFKNKVEIRAFGYGCAYPKVNVVGGEIHRNENGNYYVEPKENIKLLSVKLDVGEESITEYYEVIDLPKPNLQINLLGDLKCITLMKFEHLEIQYNIQKIKAFSVKSNAYIELSDSFCFSKQDTMYFDKVIYSNNSNSKLDTLLFI